MSPGFSRVATDVAGLPGEPLLRDGLADIRAGRDTVAANLVWIARPCLEGHHLLEGVSAIPPRDPERRLYALLRDRGGNAYGCYNALLREWVSFQRALESRRRRCPASP